MSTPRETRFQRAIRDTPGLRENKARRAIQSVVGAAGAVVVLVVVGTPSAARDQVFAFIGAAIFGFALINALEFSWHYLEAPYSLIREQLDELRAEIAALPSLAEPQEKPRKVNVRASLLLHLQRGRELLGQTVITIPQTLAWTETTAEFLGDHVAPAEAEGFLAATVSSGRRGVELRVDYLNRLADHLQDAA